MKIDEKWLMAVGGWKEMKRARTIVGAGAVVSSAYEEGAVSGTVREGNKTFKTRLTVKSANDAAISCQCYDASRMGIICKHGLAVGLAWIQRGEEKAAKVVKEEKRQAAAPPVIPEGALPPVQIIVPPTFAKQLEKGSLPLQLIEGAEDSPGGKVAVTLLGWLAGLGIQSLPAMAQLRGNQVMDFLQWAGGSSGILIGGGKGDPSALRISAIPLRLPVSAQLGDGEVTFEVTALEGQRIDFSSLDGGLWLWAKGASTLAPLASASEDGELAWLLDDLLEEGGATREVAEVLPLLSQLEDVLVFEEGDGGLGGIHTALAKPSFVLTLEGSLRVVEARLVARYDDDFDVDLQPESVGTQRDGRFPLDDGKGGFLLQHMAAEGGAAARLESLGFEQEVGGWKLRGEGDILDFYGSGIPELEEAGWTVAMAERFAHVTRDLVRIAPVIEFDEPEEGAMAPVGSGENWFSFAVRYGAAGDAGSTVSATDIQRLLRGRGDVSLPGGKRGIVDRKRSQETIELLSEVGAKPGAGGSMVADAHFAPLLAGIAGTDPPTVQALEESDFASGLGDLDGILHPYQREGVQWMAERLRSGGGVLLADEMGLGKTLQTLALIQGLAGWRGDQGGPIEPALVVCPRSLMANWRAEAAKFVPGLTTMIFHGSGRDKLRDEIPKTDIVITTYGVVAADRAFFRQAQWSVAVLDEASFIRNPTTDAAKGACGLKATARLALTGTPIENSPRDAWALFSFIAPGYMGTDKEFKERYEKPLTSQGQPDAAVASRFQKRISPYILRRKKEQVAKDLPGKIERIERIAFDAGEEALYRQILQGGLAEIDAARRNGGEGAARMTMLTTLLRLRQVCCDRRLLGDKFAEDKAVPSSKSSRLLELVNEAREGGHKMLVFSQFASMLKLLRGDLEAANVPLSYLDGGTADRQGECDRFNADSEIPIFLISLKAGGYGLNLTSADTVVHFDPWWNPAVEAQATDRAHRIGQTRPVSVHKCIVEGTVEEKILRLQQRKKQVLDLALDDAAPLMQGLEGSDLEELFDA